MTIARPLARPIVHVAGGWLARQIAALTAADGTRPAAIADFENWRFAVTTVAVGDVPSASVADLQNLVECTFDEWFAYTSSTPAAETYTDASGVLQVNGSVDTPRQDYSSGSRRLLLENASTNLLERSSEFDSGTWSKTSGITTTANSITAPDGTTTADKIVLPGTFGVQAVYRAAFTITSGQAHTLSVYAKASELRYLAVAMHAGSTTGGNEFIRVFDLQTGELASHYNTAPNNSSIVHVGDGWYRCSISHTWATTSLAVNFFPLPTDQNPRTGVTPTAGHGLYMWGAQLEAASFASSFIPTTTSSVTRAIETARFSPLLEAIMQRSAATILQRGDLSWPGTTTVRTIIGQANADESLIAAMSSTAVRARTASTSITATLGSGDLGSNAGVASAFNSSGRSLAANGGTVVSDATAQGSRAAVYLRRTAGGSYGDGLVKLVAIYPTRLSDASLQALAVA